MELNQINTEKNVERRLTNVVRVEPVPGGTRVYFKNGGNCKIKNSHRLVKVGRK